jgi:hypothetical protein
MVIAYEASNNFEDSTLKTVSSESKTEYPPEYNNILKYAETGMIIGYHATNMYLDACFL